MRIKVWVWLVSLLFHSYGFANSWENALRSKKAEINLYWYTSVPFIQQDETGVLTGIEFEIMSAFREYLRERHGVDLRLNWIEAQSFVNILETIKESGNPNDIGVSAFSINEHRKSFATFTSPYLPDIMVLVSSQGTPIVRTFDEVRQMMREMQAVTIKGTTYETQLRELENSLSMQLDMVYIESDENILVNIGKANNRYGFIDLPIYLMLVKEGGELTRQNFLTVRGTGYGFIMPQSTDWNKPFNAFFSDPKYQRQISDILSKYLGEELFRFIENLEGDLGTSILTKEKELQLALIKNANLKIQEEKAYQRILIFGIAISLLFLILIGVLFFNNQRNTRLLLIQKAQIEEQKEDIRMKNEQLLNRNSQLLSLNEEKSNLMRILAHDLRSPLSQVIGMADLVADSVDVKRKEDKHMLKQIGEGARRLNQMIDKILDVESVEGGYTKVIKESVQVTAMMQDITQRYRPLASHKNIELRVGVCAESYVLDTDHLLLLQVLENLVSNAVKFSPEGTTITFEVDCDPGYAQFVISDEGPGFTKEDMKLVFNPFQRLSAQPTGKETSTGLGLSIVKRYVSDLGGTVWIESEEGKGATFFVKIPKGTA